MPVEFKLPELGENELPPFFTDVDGNGRANSSDLLMVINHILQANQEAERATEPLAEPLTTGGPQNPFAVHDQAFDLGPDQTAGPVNDEPAPPKSIAPRALTSLDFALLGEELESLDFLEDCQNDSAEPDEEIAEYLLPAGQLRGPLLAL